ncbi:hypothetical protein P8629_12385, partial [Hydrogenovibrio sp. 3SP14C1]|uniref:hypothetical protein n=1 Tax=Hydrogenovibrio sp. 3SP14C1 TaxID=3038774 RepID=UPI00241709AB
RSAEARVNGLENPQPVIAPNRFGDAAPRTLYLRRDVENASDIIKWYKDQGVPEVYAPEALHVTIPYTKTPIDWTKMGQAWEASL